jgi:solute carrier family 35 protein F1/2
VLHCFGAALCLGSLALLVLTDTSVPRSDRARPFIGDCLVLLGALFYAASNVTQEKLLRAFPLTLSMLSGDSTY